MYDKLLVFRLWAGEHGTERLNLTRDDKLKFVGHHEEPRIISSFTHLPDNRL